MSITKDSFNERAARLKPYLLDYLAYLKCEKRTRDKWQCPICGGGDLAVWDDGEKWTCHSAKHTHDVRGTDIVDLCMAVNACDKAKALEDLEDLFFKGVYTAPVAPRKAQRTEKHSAEYIAYAKQVIANSKDCFVPYCDGSYYMLKRGISFDTCERFGVGYATDFKLWNKEKNEPYPYPFEAVIIPTDEGCAQAVKIKRKNKGDKGGALLGKRLFNKQALSAPVVFVTEGEIDAMSFEEIGAQAVGLGGIGGGDKLVEIITNAPNKPCLVLALDNDTNGAGQATQEKLAQKLTNAGYGLFIQAKVHELYGNAKDANEALTADRTGFEKRVAELIEKIKTHEQEPLMRPIFDRLQIVAERMKDASTVISTGIKEFDTILPRSGLQKGLYLVGSAPGMGKSALCLQIADRVAKQGHNVLYLSFEMAEDELLLRSLVRQCAERGVKHSAEEAEKAFLGGYLMPDEETAKHFYTETFEGMPPTLENVEKVVAQFKQMNTDCLPLVVVDYLQLIQLEDARENADTQTRLHKVAYALKRMSRDCPFLVISSLNREGRKDKKPTLEALNGSGALEYSANWVGIITERETDVEYPESEKPLTITCLKARSGRSGGKAELNLIGAEYRLTDPHENLKGFSPYTVARPKQNKYSY